jgi:hypothetical protein
MFLHSFMKLSRPLEILFSSITSQKLRKLSLTFVDFVEDRKSDWETEFESGEDDDDESAVRERIPWGSWDMALSPLAQQAHNIVTLRLKILDFNPKSLEINCLLPEFLRHGGSLDIDCD